MESLGQSLFLDQSSKNLYNPSYSFFLPFKTGSHYVVQTNLKLNESHASASGVLQLQVCITFDLKNLLKLYFIVCVLTASLFMDFRTQVSPFTSLRQACSRFSCGCAYSGLADPPAGFQMILLAPPPTCCRVLGFQLHTNTRGFLCSGD